MARPYVIAGNWKLQVTNLKDAQSRIDEIDTYLEKYPNLESFIAVPSVFLYNLKSKYLKIASENIHYTESGAYTGSTSVLSLKDAGIKYTLIGHSERRIIFKETDEEINQKVHLALQNGITPVLCIGETAQERAEGRHEEILYKQIAWGLRGVESLDNVILAYEPVWAINNKALNPDTEIRAATPKDAQETHQFIRRKVFEIYNNPTAESIRILYGGSMKPTNADELLNQPDIDGGLIGGASLKVETLGPIYDIVGSTH